jgi:hypothetical protein
MNGAGKSRCGCADAAEDAVTPAGQQLGGCSADAGRGTCDQDNAALSFRHGNSWLWRQANEGYASLKLHRQEMFKIIF